jgi:type II secretory ATPase GspE/PulE/Tfp pilus assembly ATPase PilB-like protein
MQSTNKCTFVVQLCRGGFALITPHSRGGFGYNYPDKTRKNEPSQYRDRSMTQPSAHTVADVSTDAQEKLKRSLEHQTLLNQLMQEIHSSDDFSSIMPKIEKKLLKLLDSERITVYQRSRNEQEIVSKYKTGDDVREIRVPLSTTSIAGYVALSQRAVRINDVYDADELKAIHPNLRFDSSFDRSSGFRTRCMIVVPIKNNDVLLGVMQVLNRSDGDPYTDKDMINAIMISKILGQKFRYDLGGTNGPYDHLVNTNQISLKELDTFKQRAATENISVTQLLLNETRLTPSDIGHSLERYYQVPYMPYDSSREVPKSLMQGLNESYLIKQHWVPIEGDKDEAVILIDDPSDSRRIMEIQNLLRAKNYVFKLGLPDDIRRYLGGADVSDSDVDLNELLGKLEVEDAEEDLADAGESLDENEATVIQLVNQLILDAYKNRASDIHIEPGKGKQPSTVRIRVDGVCQRLLSIPATHIRAVVSRIKVMARLDISERRKPQDGKLVVRFKGQPIELRVATIPVVHGESVVMRILAASEPLPLNKLNLTDENLKNIKQLVSHPHGIFLVVGPTGSGKTTTLHAVLGHINTPDRKIWTAEDPVEITQPGLQQVQVQPKIGFDFAAALRAFLRADPDVIMIGEMRDPETAEAGVEASLTGHLVFSTLHTNSASETVVRLLDLGIDPISFSDALLGVLAQRLVRVLCSNCKEAYTPEAREWELLKHLYGKQHWPELQVDEKNHQLYRATGCAQCGESGYRGRTGVHELLVATPEMKEIIYKKGTAAEMKELAMAQGMRTLLQDGVRKLLKGDTDLEQIRRVTVD